MPDGVPTIARARKQLLQKMLRNKRHGVLLRDIEVDGVPVEKADAISFPLRKAASTI